jgi:hypothetical protein
MRKAGMWLMALTVLAGAGSAGAHHSISLFDISTPVWVKGTVVSYQPITPHAMIILEPAGGDGEPWMVEGPFRGRLDRILGLNRIEADGAFLKAGDRIEVCGFYPKAEGSASRRFVHGHVLVMPGGRMQSWGPYGKTDNCVRPSDEPRTWSDFLNSDPLARNLWCSSRTYVRVASITSPEFADEVNRQLAEPCQ